MARDIRLQILLRPAWRNTDGIERLHRILTSIGIEPSSAGRATMSARVDATTFHRIFGRTPTTRSAGPTAADAPAVEVPASLQEIVESISIAPPHIRMTDQPRTENPQ